jgi:type VI secretion system secreted protein VgrG
VNPKSGKACKIVPPADPAEVFDADNANPGKVTEAKAEQVQQKKGKYGQTKVKPFKADPEKTSWIEIELVDEADQPVPGVTYSITLSDGATVAQGTLDGKGFARVDGIDPGICQITFPELDSEAWKRA